MTTPGPVALSTERGRVALWLAVASLVWGAVAFGALYPWAYWPLTILCAASGVAGLCARGGTRLQAGGGGLAGALALVAGVALLQLVPLPTDILGASGPRRLEILNQVDAEFAGGTVKFHGLSLDPAATIRAVALYAGFALLMLGLARCLSKKSALSLLTVIAWLGMALAVTGIIQRSLSTGSIYGIWRPPPDEHPFGPFVNRNHFAGWMLMAIPLILGYLGAIVSRAAATVRPTVRDWVLWLSSREGSQVVQAGFAVICMGLALVLTMSRSGMLSLAVALILWGYSAVRRERRALRRSAILGGLTFSAMIIVVLAGTDVIAARFAAADTVAFGGRIPIWRGAWDILQDFWLTGSGLNTYGIATLFYPAIDGHYLREAHSDYLQLALEGGLLLCIPILGAVVTFAVMVRRRFMAYEGPGYWIRLGAVIGLVAVAVQSAVEFSLQVPGNAVLFATLCALALRRDPHLKHVKKP